MLLATNIIAEQWLHPDNYNFWSSEAGGTVVKVLIFVGLVIVGRLLWPKIWRHFECDVEAPENCHRRGHPVHGTGHKACGEHHPFRHDNQVRPTRVEDIHAHHKLAGEVARGIRPHPTVIQSLETPDHPDEGA